MQYISLLQSYLRPVRRMVVRRGCRFKSVIQKDEVRFMPCATKISGIMQQELLGRTHNIHCLPNAKIYMARPEGMKN